MVDLNCVVNGGFRSHHCFVQLENPTFGLRYVPGSSMTKHCLIRERPVLVPPITRRPPGRRALKPASTPLKVLDISPGKFSAYVAKSCPCPNLFGLLCER